VTTEARVMTFYYSPPSVGRD